MSTNKRRDLRVQMCAQGQQKAAGRQTNANMLSGREVERSNIPIQRMVHRPPQASIHYVSLCSFLRPRSRRETTQIMSPKCGHARLQARRAGAKRPSLAQGAAGGRMGPGHARARAHACARGHAPVAMASNKRLRPQALNSNSGPTAPPPVRWRAFPRALRAC